MPKAFPKEFREDVIRVFKSSDSSIGISPSCLERWLTIEERTGVQLTLFQVLGQPNA